MSVMRGKVVLITGGTRGLGKAMAELLAQNGAAVVVTSRKVRSVPKKSKAPFGSVMEMPLDVTSEKSVLKLFQWLDKNFTSLDVVVNNAGVGVFKPVTELSLHEWNETLVTNLTGVFLCSKEAFRRMKKQGGGRIINIGSIADYMALPQGSAYGASKCGVRGFTQVLNEEGHPHGVRATLISPGATFTEIWQGRKGFSAKDMLQPSDVAEAVLDVARRPLRVRIDEIRILPSKGVL